MGLIMDSSEIRPAILMSVLTNRFRRYPAVILLMVVLCSLAAIHICTSNMTYSLDPSPYSRHSLRHGLSSTGAVSKVKHVIFVKVHKAASTTLMTILVRFGVNNNLTMMIPTKRNILSEHGRFNGKNILPPMGRRTYDLLFNHVIFNQSFLSPLFHSDSSYVTILRDPFEQTVSAFMYYRHVYPLPYLWRIKGEFPVSKYLSNPRRYEPANEAMSFTNNRMSIDLGFQHVWSRNVTLAREFIKQVEKTFKLVLLTEYFDESIILLKRLFNWNFKDILYISGNSLQKGHEVQVSPSDRKKHEVWAWVDTLLYNHFYQVFWDRVHAEGKLFFREVHTFKNVRKLWKTFCIQKSNNKSTLHIAKTDWNEEFTINRVDCNIAMSKEMPLMEDLRKKYYKQMGMVDPYSKSSVKITPVKKKPVAKNAVGGNHVQTNINRTLGLRKYDRPRNKH